MRDILEVGLHTGELKGDDLVRVEGKRKGKVSVFVDSRITYETLFLSLLSMTRAFIVLAKEVHDKEEKEILDDLAEIFDFGEMKSQRFENQSFDKKHDDILKLAFNDEVLRNDINYLSEIAELQQKDIDDIFKEANLHEFVNREMIKQAGQGELNPVSIYAEALKVFCRELRARENKMN